MSFSAKIKMYKAGSYRGMKKKPGVSKEEREKPVFSRIHLLFLFFAFLSFLIVFRLYNLQVLAYESYRSLSQNQHWIFKNLIPKRGEIYALEKDKLYPVALNRETKMAYGVPKEIENPLEAAEKISEILGLDRDGVFRKLSKPEDAYEALKHRLTEEEIEKVNSLRIKGIRLSEESYRYYPAGELAANVLGFVGWKDDDFGGRYGIELGQEERLAGSPGSFQAKKDASGGWVSVGDREMELARDGDNIVLTIDHIIQYEAEKLLRNAVSKFKAERGAIVVMEVETGKIRAMANYPTFNPNEYSLVAEMENFRNLSISDAYECGSVFKAFTMAAAIDDGKVNPDTQYVDTGSVTQSGYTIRNSDLKSYGRQTMTGALEHSLNTGVIFAEKLLGNRKFAEYVERFGFGAPTGVELFGEARGNINNLKNLKSDIQFFTASFGQGITVTPIQLTAAYNTIANGGVLVKPRIIEKFIKSDGAEEKIHSEEGKRVISGETARLVSQMLGSVVKNGHGKMAGVPGHLVGGKTGTAQVAKKGEKGYEEGTNIGSFAGFAPLDNPRYTVSVRVDNPKEVVWAESSAAPVFGELMKFLLEYANVEPTEEYTQKDLEKFAAAHNLGSYAGDEKNDKNEEKKRE